jgi:hypothetical protein
MTYALIITIAAAVALLALAGGGTLLARRALGVASRGEVSLGRWRWYPSQWGWLLFLLLPVAAIVLWRFFPVFLFLPIIVPFFWRWSARGRAFGFGRRPPRRQRPSSNGHHNGHDRSIEGSYRAADDEE